jgi:predicted RNA-binding Zn-ribbon protein involved in translation (DUF1610 family)
MEVGESAVGLDVGGGIIPPPQVKQKARKSLKTPLATLKPRVKCSKCDFTGKQGKEMERHIERKHQTEFKCRECNFVTGKKVLRRQHMKRAHDKKKKCESCNFEAENGSTLKTHRQSEHGIVSTSVGFMFTNERQNNENPDVEKPEESEGPSKKRKNKSEYLRDVKQVKTSKSKKNMTRSMKDQYLTLKKSVANLQRIHGVDSEFMLIVKKNIQSRGAKNSAPTAGKYMVIAEGKLNQQFFGSGVKFDENFVIMANDFDMQIQEPQNNA